MGFCQNFYNFFNLKLFVEKFPLKQHIFLVIILMLSFVKIKKRNIFIFVLVTGVDFQCKMILFKIEKASLYMASNGPLTLFVLRYIFQRFLIYIRKFNNFEFTYCVSLESDSFCCNKISDFSIYKFSLKLVSLSLIIAYFQKGYWKCFSIAI